MSSRTHQALLAEGLARQGALAPAVEACAAALRADETDAASHALLGELLLSADAYDDAIEAATRAIEIDPDFAPAYLVLGLAYERRGGMWDQAVLVWHELAEVAPALTTAHVQLGEAFLAAGFEEEAIAAWRAAIALDASEARAMYDLAMAALRREGVPTALPGFRKAGELDPSQDDLFFALAGVYDDGTPAPDPASVAADRRSRLDAAAALAFEEDLFAAADLLRLVLADEHDDAEALALSGYLYLKQEATFEAMACALRAMAVEPKTVTAAYVLGVAFSRRQGMNAHAARVFSALASARPDLPLTHVLLGEALLGEGAYARAGEVYRRAVDLDPTCVRARFGLAAVLFSENRYAEAVWEMRQAAYYDTRRQSLFWTLWDDRVGGGESTDADA